jgi:hypothetical protein
MSMDEPSRFDETQGSATHAGHEERDVAFRPVVGGLVGIFLVTVLVFVLVAGVFRYLVQREAETSPAANPLAGTYGRQLPPEPRLQSKPVRDLRQFRATEDAQLNSYGWVDRRAGMVHIPIARAMELLVQRGLPVRPAAPVPAAAGREQ